MRITPHSRFARRTPISRTAFARAHLYTGAFQAPVGVAPSLTSALPTLSMARHAAIGGTSIAGHFAGTVPITFALSPGSNALPAGVALGADGSVTGTPTMAGTHSVIVRASNEYGYVDAPLSFVIADAGVAPSLATVLPSISATQHVAINAVSIAGHFAGTVPITFDLAPGSDALPSGLSLSAAGQVSGVPIVTGNVEVTVRASNAYGTATATLSFSITASPAASLWQIDGQTVEQTPAAITARPIIVGNAVAEIMSDPAQGHGGWVIQGQTVEQVPADLTQTPIVSDDTITGVV